MASTNASPNLCSSATKITDLHTDIMATHILPRIDYSSLASAALASSELHALCNHEKVWTEICNSIWHSTKHVLVQSAIASFPAGHRSFFNDAFPILDLGHDRNYWWQCNQKYTSVERSEQLISAIDMQYKKKIVYSTADVIDTSTIIFESSFFKVNVLDKMEYVRLPVKCEDEDDNHISDLKENLTLSWIIIDPTQKRAANISSVQPVSVRPHWIDGDIEVKYALVMPRNSSESVEIRIIVMLAWEDDKKYLKLTKVKLQVQDMDSNCLCGIESLRILQEAIQNGTRKKQNRGLEMTERYKQYVYKKRERREARQKIRRQSQMTAVPLLLVIILVALLILMISKFLYHGNL